MASATVSTSSHALCRRRQRPRRSIRPPPRSAAAGSVSARFHRTARSTAFYRDRNVWLSAPTAADERRHHHRRQRDGARQVRHGELGLRRGAAASAPRCGGRPTAARSPTTASTRATVPDYYLAARPDADPGTLDIEAYPKAGAPNPIVDLFVYDVASKQSTRDRRPRRQAVRQHGGRPLRVPRRVVARRQRAALQPHQPPAEHDGARGRESGDRRDAAWWCARSGRPGWVENRPAMVFLERRQALHLGVAAQRLEQLLSLRSERQADRAADDAHGVRSRRRS